MTSEVAETLRALLDKAGLPRLSEPQEQGFAEYVDLIQKWNTRTNLTSRQDRDSIVGRHVLECIACAQILPAQVKSLLDLGSGAGFPGIPISICRPEIAVTLAESQNKKAAFLNEVVRRLRLNARVYAGRAESMQEIFDCVTMRAVDRMEEAVTVAISLLSSGGGLIVMTTESLEPQLKEIPGISWGKAVHLPASEQRIALLGIKV
jgi:16S rRNA (guanine527-N7)-methyltransferase